MKSFRKRSTITPGPARACNPARSAALTPASPRHFDRATRSADAPQWPSRAMLSCRPAAGGISALRSAGVAVRGWQVLDDITRVVQLAGKTWRRAEAALEARHLRIAVDQQAVVVTLEALVISVSRSVSIGSGPLRSKRSTDAAPSPACPMAAGARIASGAGRRKELGQKHPGAAAPRAKQRFTPPALPGLVHRIAVLVQQLLESSIAGRGRQLPDAISRDRPSMSARQRDLEPGLLQRLRRRGGTPQMADAQRCWT